MGPGEGTELLDHFLERFAVARRRFQDGEDDGVLGVFHFVRAYFAKDERARGDGAGDLILGLDLVLAVAEEAQAVEGVRVEDGERTLVDVAGERAQDEVDGDEEQGDEDGVEQLAGAGAGSHGGGAPEGSGGVEAADVAAVLHDGAGPKKADSGYDVGDDLGGSGGDGQAEVGEGRGSEADEGVGAQASCALTSLALGADAGAEDKGEEKTRNTGLIYEGRGVGPPVGPRIHMRFVISRRS